MRRYFTGLVPNKDEFFKDAICGRGWRAVCCKARAENRKVMANCRKELAIDAPNARSAQKALNLIRTAHQIWDASPDVFGYHFKVIPADSEEHKKLYPNHLLERIGGCFGSAGFPEACRMAAKASVSRSLVYAFALFHLSQNLHANHPMDLGPDLFPHDHRSPFPDDHVRFAYSIVTAYAVLEQLGLALHGEAFRDGEWIAEKKLDLERRLQGAALDLSSLMQWQIRGGKTRIERARRTRPVKKAEWAFGAVRDIEIEIADAIADVRWLRSRVAAHDIKELAELISVYDVANVQDLARRCIMASLGYERK